MYSLRIGIISAVLFGLAIAPLAFADDDDDNGNWKSKRKNDDRKSWVFHIPFISIGTTTDALMGQIRSLQEALANLKAQREALDDDDDDDGDDDDDDNNASSTRAMRDTLKADIRETKAEIRQTKRELRFLRSLSRGMSGDDVRDLQELLALDSSIFPADLITGFFGRLTEEAIRKFQRKHGIDAIGIFGPKTQAKLLALFVGRELPPGIIRRLGLETSSTTPGAGFVTICHIPPGNTSNKQTLVIGVPALGAHLAHGDTVGVCAGSGTGTTTPPTTDTIAPMLSAISASSTASTTAQVLWTTNEAASSKVWFGTSTPLTLGGTTANVFNGTFVTSHALGLSGLTASTTYQYVVESRDATSNIATSSAQSFTTQP